MGILPVYFDGNLGATALRVAIILALDVNRVISGNTTHGWSGEGVKLLQQKLKEAGFTVVEENVRSLWNPGEADYAEIPDLARALLS